MQQELLRKLMEITPEEQQILDGDMRIQSELYTKSDSFPDLQEASDKPSKFTIDSKRLLQRGQLIELRPHTRFIHFPAHKHNYIELVYMCNGTTTHRLNNSDQLTLEKGDLLFLNQDAVHEILPAGPEDIAVNFIILPEFFNQSVSMIEQENILRDFLLQTLSGRFSGTTFLHFTAKDILPVQNLMENMIWTIFSDQKNTNTITQTTMALLLMNLSRFTETLNHNTPKQYEQIQLFRVLKYLETHYKAGTLSEISEELKQPTYWVSRLLKKHMNKNFKELLQERKLQQAAYLLSQSSLTIEQIMDTIGYENSSYFYRSFRAKYDCSPGEYREHR